MQDPFSQALHGKPLRRTGSIRKQNFAIDTDQILLDE